MSRPSPQFAEDRDDKRQRADAALDSALSAPPISGAASTGSSATTEPHTQPQPQQSIAQRCHNDALHCIIAFLRLKELLPALHSCRSWNAAGSKEPSRGLRLSIQPTSIAALVASPLRHHVADLHLSERVGLDQLRQLHSLPRLTALDAALDAAELDAFMEATGHTQQQQQRAQLLPAAFPAQLHSVTLWLVYDGPAALRTRQAVVDALPSAPSLRAVTLHVSVTDVDLSPLLRLPQLSSLRVHDSLLPVQCAVIKQLAALATLRVTSPHWWPDALLELLRPPHALQRLEEITLNHYKIIDPPLLAGLLSLPALTTLRSRLVDPDCWAGLDALTQLRTLCVNWDQPFTAAQRSALELSLNALPHLSDLSLWLPFDSQSDGPPLALRLPALRGLDLNSVRLPSLSFLQHSPLLESLFLRDCGQLGADELLGALAAHPPPRLSELRLDRCDGLGYTVQQRLRAALDPPSALLPQLRSFEYFD